MATYDKELIVRYAEDELTGEEKQQFETALRTDPSLAAELSLYRELKETLSQRLAPDATGEALRATLSELKASHFATAAATATATATPAPRAPGPAPGAKRIHMVRWVTSIAAAACILAVTLLLVLPSRNKRTFDELGHTEMLSTTERGTNADSLLQQAAVFFNRQEFAKALPLLDKAVKSDSSSQLALFYRGIAGWHTGATDAARTDLQQVYNGESLLRYEAAFYMALIYASEKNNTAATEWLKKIPEGTPVSARAKELEDKLK
jgi:tetratricopeptide (TPR) repeat protein